MYDCSMEKLVYQMFILGCGEMLNKALAKNLGGVIFFTKDIPSEKIFTEKIAEIKSKSVTPPFLSIDQEGGRVERTENIRPKRLSAREAYNKGVDFLSHQSAEISRELRDWGINLNFAPCADVNTNPNNPIIGIRSFSDKTDDVIKGVKIFSDMSKKFNVIPCIKHYPGHGDADKDSHLTLPEIKLPMDEMGIIHIKPFKAAISDGIDMIMAAHLHCTCFDEDAIPASLSKNAIKYLRKDLGYNRVIITDDMVMKGVQDFGGVEACIMAIQAGVDMFIYRDSDKQTIEIIDELVKVVERDDNLKSKVFASNERIKKLKEKYQIIK